MEAQILDAMYERKRRIKAEALDALRRSRVERMRTIVNAYQRNFSPHDFYPSVDDVCRIPDILKVIMEGTDEEFDACAGEVTSRLPELTSQLLEERTLLLSALIPLGVRVNLSLATTWFKCGLCNSRLIHGQEALKHECLRVQGSSDGLAGGTTFDTILRRGWCADDFVFSRCAFTAARELISECFADPESITLDEINSKLYRFILDEGGKRHMYSWMERVSLLFS